MTTIDTHAGAPAGAAHPNLVARVSAWIISSDHKKIGRLLIGESLVAAVVALRSLAADTIFMALVICRVFFTEPMRLRMSRSDAMVHFQPLRKARAAALSGL